MSKIKSAADVYLSSNPTEQNKLYSTKSYLLIKIGDLTKSGLVDKNIIDPTTSEKISSDSKVMASLDENGTVIFDYPLDQSKTEYL